MREGKKRRRKKGKNTPLLPRNPTARAAKRPFCFILTSTFYFSLFTRPSLATGLIPGKEGARATAVASLAYSVMYSVEVYLCRIGSRLRDSLSLVYTAIHQCVDAMQCDDDGGLRQEWISDQCSAELKQRL